MFDVLINSFKGDTEQDKDTLDKFSHDTSLFEVVPKLVMFPRDSADVTNVINFVAENKKAHPELSITARSGGTDMSGGAINDSIILVFERYMNNIGSVEGDHIYVQPGAYYRDFEKVTLASGMIMPSYPASKGICGVGGMVANRAGGEKSLIYGTTEDYVSRIIVILRDGKDYELAPLNEEQLHAKMAQDDFEGGLYRDLFNLIDSNYDLIQSFKPKVSKNATGYDIWGVWNRETKIFDITKLFVGSQGTLGMITDIDMRLVEEKKFSGGLLVGYVTSLEHLGPLINDIIAHNPSSFETFDDHTLKFAIRFFLQFRKTLGYKKFIKLGLSFIPDVFIMAKEVLTGKGLPKLIILVEFEGDTQQEVTKQIAKLKSDLHAKDYEIDLESADNNVKSERFWLMRHESFNLLRKNTKGNVHTSPFIDDLIVPPVNLPKFLPEFREILERYKLNYTIAGHMGDGNFHVIPFMDFSKPEEVGKIEPVLKECIELVKKYDGSMSGEHNDGLIRGPFLSQMYSKEIFDIFSSVKSIFDPENIFNPHKKTTADWEFSKEHMREHF